MSDWEPIKRAVLNGFGHLRVLVVGDVMLDHYVWGSVTRVSPEAPVPVVKFERESEMLGGAANVASNLINLGVQTELCGLVGADARGKTLQRLAVERGLDASGLIETDEIRTTTKMRFLGEQHQLLRVDDETSGSVSQQTQARIKEHLAARLEAGNFDAIVLSDYAKAVATPELCQTLIGQANALNIAVHVDPKGKNFEKYHSAASVKPNRSELALATDLGGALTETLIERASELKSELALGFLTLTLGAEGAVVIDEEGTHKVPTHAREVYDVSGAGDTTLAAMVAGVAAGLKPAQAVRLASLAAAQVVAHVGSTPVSLDELILALFAMPGNSAKTMSAAEGEHVLRAWQNKGVAIERVQLGSGDLVVELASVQEKGRSGKLLLVQAETRTEQERQLIGGMECVVGVVS